MQEAAPVVGVAVAVTVAVAAGSAFLAGDRSETLLPLAVAGGLGLTALAFARFELFVTLVLVMRASMDAAKIGSSSVDATGALSVLFIAATAAWLVRHRGELTRPSPTQDLVLPFAAFFTAAILSIGFSGHPLESAVEAVRIGTVVVIVVALGRIVDDWRRVRTIAIAILASALVPLGVAAYQLTGGSRLLTFEGFSRISGTFLHPNPFGTYLFLILVLIASLFPHVSRARRWVLLAPLAAGCAGILIVTYSRGAWVAALVGLIVVGALQNRRLLWVLAAGVVIVGISFPSVGIRVSDLAESQAPSGAPANSLTWRIQYWDQVLALQDNPILGIGLREVELNEEAEKAPHNDYLRVYVETGILGLVAYGWLVIALFVQATKTYRRAPAGLPHGLAVAFVATLTGLVILSIVANVISQLVILWYFAAIVVLALVASRLPRESAPAL